MSNTLNLDMLAEMLQSMAAPQDDHSLAAMVCRNAIRQDLAGPAVGGRVRCVWAKNTKAFPSDAFVLEEGRVYDVIETGLAAFDIDAAQKANHNADDAARARANILEQAEKHPNAPSLILRLRDPKSGEELGVMYPAYPGAIIVEVKPEEIDRNNDTYFEIGQTLTFEKANLVTAVAENWVTAGKAYRIDGKKMMCNCDDEDCPGRKITVAVFVDDHGDAQEVQVPFSHLGIATLN